MKRVISIFVIVSVFLSASHAQMYVNSDTLYGNEWIKFDQEYHKVLVHEDGIYRVNVQTLVNQGVDLSGVSGDNLQLFFHGKEIPIFVSNPNSLANNDFIEFYGKKNIGDLDEHLVPSPEKLTNKYYSLFNDTSAYFLTWNNNFDNNRLTPTANDLSNLPSPESFYMAEQVNHYTNKYLLGFIQNGDNFEARIDIGEGWSTGYTSSRTLTVSVTNAFASGPDAEVDVQVFSNFGSHNLEISFNGAVQVSDIFNNYRLNKYSFPVPASGVMPNNTVVIAGTLDDDSHSVAYITMKYPRTFGFDGAGLAKFTIEGSTQPKYLEITDFDVSGTPFLYDMTNGLSIQTTVDGSTVRVKLPPSVEDRELVLINRNFSIPVTEDMIEDVEFIDYFNTQGNFVILSNELLYDDGLGNNWVQAYADYRASTGYTPVILEVQQVYDQFCYGVTRHLQSFRNFAHFAKKNWTTIPPHYLFIIGKGRGYTSVRSNPAVNLPIEKVPTFSESDNLLTANVYSDVPLLSTGRVAAYTAAEVKIYLDKIMAYEGNSTLPQTIEDKAWMKRIIHLGGGDVNIQQAIRNNLNSYKSIIENSSYGASVFSFFKTSTDPIQISQSDFLDSLINDGSSIITFFGHSSPNSFDFNLDSPDAYENFERYPLIFSLGCFTGNIFKRNKGLSEEFVLIEDKGAIGFLASTQLSAFGSLNAWGDKFYKNLGNEYYGQGIGDVLRAIVQSLDNSNFETRRLNQFMVLHGDPAMRLNAHEAPDYLVKGTDISFNPGLITTQLDSFDLNVTLTNIGQAVTDSFHLVITRELPDGTLINAVDDFVKSPIFESTFTYKLPVRDDALGLNKFCFTADQQDDVAEGPLPSAESNNGFCLNQYVLSDDIIPVFPYAFSIVSEPGATLKASAANAFGDELEFFMEIDTTENFNSPLLKTTSVFQSGGTIQWTPEVQYIDNTVYYWRVQVNPLLVPNTSGWKTQSFVYINNESPGWNQSHFFQFQKDDYRNINLKPNREFAFITDFLELSVDISYPGILANDQIAFYINGSKQYHFGYCGQVGIINFAVFDPISGTPWINNPDGTGGIYESFECRPLVPNFAYHATDSISRAAAMNFLENIVPDGFYVLAYTFADYQPDTWLADSTSVGDKTLFSVFESFGADQLRNMIGNPAPYSAFMRKGSPSFAQENFALQTTDELNSVFQLPGSWNNGYVESPKIGPANGWSSLLWQTSALDGMPENDVISVDVFGLDADENQTLIVSGVQATDTTLAFIDSGVYPYLKLRFNSSDVVNESSAQLDYWRVLYDEIPDAALRPEVLFSLDSDTIQQGKDLTMQIAIENLTRTDMDSLLIKYVVTDLANNEVIVKTRMAPLLGEDTLTARLVLPTRNLNGTNRIFIEANPDGDQDEQFHFNNIALVDFHVTPDILNPILDVTFDAKHILEGDIVSARPNILITLKDENKFLELGDTALFKVLFQYPGEAGLRQVYFDNDVMTFFPANPNLLGSENKATIELNPIFVTNGTYQLFVQAEDATGNQSGDLDYKVSFEVITEASVSNVLNYPNPFTSSTRFVFTLTGSDLPDFMKIQIMTVSGKVIREIHMDELGPVRIGNNLTDFAWDGTDQYGDRLANGVYLYRVITQYNGEEMKRYQTNTNQYFKEGLGKMYLMR